MLQKERHDHILAKLNLESSIRVRDIALEYNVTEDCIRKDLAILEKEGKLKRIHGGAVSIRENPHTFNVSARLDKYVEEKKGMIYIKPKWKNYSKDELMQNLNAGKVVYVY